MFDSRQNAITQYSKPPISPSLFFFFIIDDSLNHKFECEIYDSRFINNKEEKKKLIAIKHRHKINNSDFQAQGNKLLI